MAKPKTVTLHFGVQMELPTNSRARRKALERLLRVKAALEGWAGSCDSSHTSDLLDVLEQLLSLRRRIRACGIDDQEGRES
jgi:uncharacterized protein (DUF2342 family)